MRTRTIARWRRAAVAGMLAATLASPGRAQQDLPPPVPVPQQAAEPGQPATLRAAKTLRKTSQQAEAPEQPAPAQQPEQPQRDEQPQRAEQAQRPENAALPITEDSLRPPPDNDVKPVAGAPDEYTIQKGDTLWDLS